MAAQFKFVKFHENEPEDFWRSVLWTDETRVEMFAHSAQQTWRQSKAIKKDNNTKNICSPHFVKHKLMDTKNGTLNLLFFFVQRFEVVTSLKDFLVTNIMKLFWALWLQPSLQLINFLLAATSREVDHWIIWPAVVTGASSCGEMVFNTCRSNIFFLSSGNDFLWSRFSLLHTLIPNSTVTTFYTLNKQTD